MRTALDDIRAVLLRVEQRDDRETNVLGKHEIHPLAFYLKEHTDELFQHTQFTRRYSGVRSPDVQESLCLFEYDTDRFVLEAHNNPDIETSDEYFKLHYEDDKTNATQRYSELNSETKTELDAALDSLFEDRLAFIQQQAKTLNSPKPH